MKIAYALYGVGFGFITAGFVMELRELQKRRPTWHEATLDGQESSSSRPSPQPQRSQPTTSE